jgi:integrase
VITALGEIVGKGDPPLDDLTLDVAEKFRQGMLGVGLAPNTVRRRITTIKAMLNCYIKDKRLTKEVDNNFNGLSVADPEGRLDRERREALALTDIKACVSHIQSKNVDIQDLWLLQMFTGARPKELSGLLWDDVDLVHATPHILIRANALRRLKTKGSKRAIPLVGVALEAMFARAKGRVEGIIDCA